MSVKDDILTRDNALHAAVAVFVVVVTSLVSGPGFPWIAAGLIGLLLYLREASQVDWDFTLRFSAHKHLEWIVGTVAAFIAAAIMALVG
jgi:hypothetical protein